MDSRKVFLLVIALVMTLGLYVVASAQSPTYGLGKPPNPDKVRALDIAINPDGKPLRGADGKPVTWGVEMQGAVQLVVPVPVEAGQEEWPIEAAVAGDEYEVRWVAV